MLIFFFFIINYNLLQVLMLNMLYNDLIPIIIWEK